MENERMQRVARVDLHDLAEMSSTWTNQERGQYLRLLLHGKGIDPHQFYRIEYYPQRRYWLVIQEHEPSQARKPAGLPSHQADEAFYLQTIVDFRRTARTAFSALAAQSSYFACNGCKYQLPAKPQEVTPAALVNLLGGSRAGDSFVRFDNEGGWRTGPTAN